MSFYELGLLLLFFNTKSPKQNNMASDSPSTTDSEGEVRHRHSWTCHVCKQSGKIARYLHDHSIFYCWEDGCGHRRCALCTFTTHTVQSDSGETYHKIRTLVDKPDDFDSSTGVWKGGFKRTKLTHWTEFNQDLADRAERVNDDEIIGWVKESGTYVARQILCSVNLSRRGKILDAVQSSGKHMDLDRDEFLSNRV